MVALASLPSLPAGERQGYRLVNSKYPPIDLFDDVASADEFAMLHELQALTNPRLRAQVGDMGLVSREEIPFGIPGCSYAVAPFTHVNPAGSRFSAGAYGVLYIADVMETALAEVRYHQEAYWRNVPGLNFERFVFRGLRFRFHETGMLDGLVISETDPVYDPDDLSAARALGRSVKHAGLPGLRYRSVRRPGAMAWALMTPRPVIAMVQTAHYEMVWNGAITAVNRLSTP
ncbi:RES family NAD+ phosphorylase [Halomonas sp.]|uniref:RES family NAD+ phosphorylase n=1 Tax=Halomonas sp. TaxID=1486246 RepID=UPI003D139912